MATLVLTVVGGAIGGPIGAALGGALGNAIDQAVLFKPKGRQGPRLTELAVQTSAYGAPIPLVFGTMRVAGNVVWATDLKESRARSGGGKGRPSVTTYSYSASFAVLLSGRPIDAVGRIWADGKLLRGAAGDLKVATGLRVHTGGADQAADPLIAALEGSALAPALRGQAYAMFEDLQLADYGNRIPSLTFEVIADGGGTAVGTVAAALGVSAGAGRALTGFSAYGDSVRGVLETLASVDGAWFAPADGGIAMRSGPGAAAASVIDAGVAAGVTAPQRRVRNLGAADAAPRALSLAHYDPARDYQTGLQRAERPGGGRREERVELPAALPAGAARGVAEGMIARAAARRERRMLAVGIAAGLGIAPGMRVAVAGESGQWRVARWTLERMVVRLELERIARAPAAVVADPGRASAAPDAVHGATELHAFELPALGDEALAAPRVSIAAAGGPGWRQAALLTSLDGGARWSAAGATAAPATIGSVLEPPGAAESAIIDRRHAVVVELLHDDMELHDADAAALDAGANLALLGDELVQFGQAARIAPRRWRLSELWRGRRGTEWAAGAHGAGERFVLIEADALHHVELPVSALGGTLKVLASGIGDGAGPVAADVAVAGAAIRPPSVIGLGWTGTADGGATLRWTRRSRLGWSWRDGGDAPLGEEAERYHVVVAAGGSVREETVPSPQFSITPAERSAGSVTATVRQLGTWATSPPAVITF